MKIRINLGNIIFIVMFVTFTNITMTSYSLSYGDDSDNNDDHNIDLNEIRLQSLVANIRK